MAAAYTPLRVEIAGRAFHSTLFARLHTSKAADAELPAQRTLFAVNVPHGATEAGLRAAFERLGVVSEVRLGRMAADGPSTAASAASTAHIVFESAATLKAALKSKKALRLTLAAAPATTRAPESREQLQRAVDGFLKKFEADERQREKEELAQKGQMDADGFVVVGRRGRALGEPAQKEAEARKKKKKSGGAPADFYHFQQHERKREQLLKLREQFEADKARIAKMRSERKFRPY